jgi:hypothetical protein
VGEGCYSDISKEKPFYIVRSRIHPLNRYIDNAQIR